MMKPIICYRHLWAVITCPASIRRLQNRFTKFKSNIFWTRPSYIFNPLVFLVHFYFLWNVFILRVWNDWWSHIRMYLILLIRRFGDNDVGRADPLLKCNLWVLFCNFSAWIIERWAIFLYFVLVQHFWYRDCWLLILLGDFCILEFFR